MRDCPQCPQLVLIAAGSFNMGSTEMFPFEAPIHHVTIRKPFYIGQREVTLEQWDACVAEGACSYSPGQPGPERGSLPVTNVDWNDAQQYLGWLMKKTGKTYRLPSESEWEYATRAGTATTYPWGRQWRKATQIASAAMLSRAATPSQPDLTPNDFGLYDIAGNAAEWVEDCWRKTYSPLRPMDPPGQEADARSAFCAVAPSIMIRAICVRRRASNMTSTCATIRTVFVWCAAMMAPP